LLFWAFGSPLAGLDARLGTFFASTLLTFFSTFFIAASFASFRVDGDGVGGLLATKADVEAESDSSVSCEGGEGAFLLAGGGDVRFFLAGGGDGDGDRCFTGDFRLGATLDLDRNLSFGRVSCLDFDRRGVLERCLTALVGRRLFERRTDFERRRGLTERRLDFERWQRDLDRR